MEFYGSKHPANGWLMPCKKRCSCRLNWQKSHSSIQNDTEIASPYTPNDELRPSIETAMHAVLRHRVVLHVHSVNAIAWAIRLDGPDRLTERLAGLHWQWIPYAASGKTASP